MPWRPSTSTRSVRFPSVARASARAAATVVLPVPGLALTTRGLRTPSRLIAVRPPRRLRATVAPPPVPRAAVPPFSRAPSRRSSRAPSRRSSHAVSRGRSPAAVPRVRARVVKGCHASASARGSSGAVTRRPHPVAGRCRPAAERAVEAGVRVGAMTKWEYATVPLLVHATKQILDTWGEDGWELVQVVPGPNNPEQLVAYLKREKQA